MKPHLVGFDPTFQPGHIISHLAYIMCRTSSDLSHWGFTVQPPRSHPEQTLPLGGREMNAHGHALTCFVFSLKRKDLGRLHRNLLPGRAQPRARYFSESGSWTTGQNHLERLLEVQVRGTHPAPTVSVCSEHVHLFDSEVPTASSESHTNTHTHTRWPRFAVPLCVLFIQPHVQPAFIPVHCT